MRFSMKQLMSEHLSSTYAHNYLLVNFLVVFLPKYQSNPDDQSQNVQMNYCHFENILIWTFSHVHHIEDYWHVTLSGFPNTDRHFVFKIVKKSPENNANSNRCKLW